MRVRRYELVEVFGGMAGEVNLTAVTAILWLRVMLRGGDMSKEDI